MQAREVRILFTTTGGQSKNSSVHAINCLNIQIDFLIDGDEALEKVKEIIYEKFVEECWKDAPEEHRLRMEGFKILAWSAFETNHSQLTMDEVEESLRHTFAPFEQRRG